MNPDRLRRDLLGALLGQPAYTGDVPDLRAALDRMGRPAAAEAVRQTLVWLASAECVYVGKRANGAAIVTLAERGRDVWRDLVQIPGIARPELGETAIAASAAAAADILKG